MQAIALPLRGLIGQVKDHANAFVFSVLIFSYQALEHDFPCSCKPQLKYCAAYIFVPCFIITVLMLSTDLQFQRAWRYERTRFSCHFGCVLLRRTVKAVCVGLLWFASVLIDAEWFVCCCNPNPKDVADLQCKAKAEITPAGKPVVTIAEMKMNSRMYGMSLLFAVVLVGSVFLSAYMLCADSCGLRCCRRDVEVHVLLLEVEEDVVSKTIKKEQETILRDKVKEHIDQGKWVDCLDVVENLIDQEGDKTQNHHETDSLYLSQRELQQEDQSETPTQIKCLPSICD